MRRKLHRHDLSKEHNFSANMGKLIPTHMRLVYPGDIVRQRSQFFVRVSPLLAPIYSKCMIKAETFYVASDMVWDSAGKFYSKGQDGTDTTVIPTIRLGLNGRGAVQAGDLMNHLGIAPTGAVTDLYVNALPARCVNAIYNWRYRNFDLQSERVINTGDGVDNTTDISLPSRNWEHDRFTTMRVEPQRGDDVLIPTGTPSASITGKTPVMGIGIDNNLNVSGTNETGVRESNTSTRTYANYTDADSTNVHIKMSGSGTSSSPEIFADFDQANDTAAVSVTENPGTIRELEEAVAINRFRLRLQQADGSYPDYTLATFGIRAPDIELQKPVLLATSNTPLQISEVLQTAQQYDSEGEPIGSPVGEYTGHGIAVVQGHGYKYRVKRHGYIITLFSVVPKPMYMQGFDKEFLRSTQEDYFDPDLDQIGEESVDKREMYTQATAAHAGYQYRNYCDRSSLDTISGEFQTTLDFYTQARKFSSAPELNSTFVTCDPSDRIFAYGSTQNQLRVKALHDVKMLRVMRRIPMRGIL